MKEVLSKKLDKISDIWNNYIWEYKFCNSKIKFTPDVRSNYFGDILSYFSDTFNLIYNNKKTETFSDNIESAISFLQAIYIQQDFIEELLHIFKCEPDKGHLKKDPNYSINRELRNELVGHPIRKSDINGKRQLLSSTIFSNATGSEQISYIRYHLDNNYKFEQISHSKENIVNRHSHFVEVYFDIILKKLKDILILFKAKIEEIEKVVDSGNFKNIIKITSVSFESIFKTDYLYNPDLLLQIYDLKEKGLRYSNAIKMFQDELKDFLLSSKENITNLVNDTDRHSLKRTDEQLIIPKIIITYNDDKIDISKIQVSYTYEMGKLVDRSDHHKFTFFSSLLKDKCVGNELVLAELQNMEDNFDNTLEYYCSYHLIDRKLIEGKI